MGHYTVSGSTMHENVVADIMTACIILHDMIIDDEGFAAER